MNYDITPLDSPATIDAVFQGMASFGAKRVYWRGEQDRIWIERAIFRPELPLYYDYWVWERHLNETVKTNELAIAAAHRNGMQIYYYDGLFEYGSQGDAPGCGILPYQAEERVRIEHPEWVLCDRWGERRSPGPLEYAYPGARKQLIERVLHYVEPYDGVAFYTYAENEGYRYPEEFGFNEPIVREFKRRYGVDIRTQEFDRDAWYRLRGEYVTQLFRELHAALSKKGKKLSIMVYGEAPNVPMGWQRYTAWTTIGPIRMDYEQWIREGIVDEILILHNDGKLAVHIAEVKKDKPLSIIVLGAANEAESKAGATTMTDIWFDVCAGRTTPAAVTAADLTSTDWAKRAQVLIDAARGALKLDAADVAKAVSDPHVLVRRQALRTLAAMKAGDQVAVIENALDDHENSVRAAAAAALAIVNGPDSAARLLQALGRDGAFQVKNAAVSALKAMLAKSEPKIIAGLADSSEAVREACARALPASTSVESKNALMEVLRRDPDYRVRYYALAALAGRKDAALSACRLALDDRTTTVQLAAVRGFGKIAATMSESQAARIMPSLVGLFRTYGDGCKRSDAAWGWRVVGNSIAAFGEKGKAQLEAFRAQREDKWLAWAAYQVLYVPQADNGATLTTEKEAVQAHTKYAPPFPGWRVDKVSGGL